MMESKASALGFFIMESKASALGANTTVTSKTANEKKRLKLKLWTPKKMPKAKALDSQKKNA